MSSVTDSSVGVPASVEPTPGVWSRTLSIFVRPNQAWAGLDRRVRFWFPLLLVAILSAVAMLATYDKVMLPTILEPMQRQVSEGQMPQAQADRMEEFFGSPAGKAINVGTQFLGVIVSTFLVALFVWLGGAFILGRAFSYRLALEVASWAGLVTLPGVLLVNGIAFARGTSLRAVHLGFGALLPEPEAPSKLLNGLGVFLDAIGPLGIWYLAVVILGVSSLAGSPRKTTAWVMAGLYLALILLAAGLAAVFSPGT
jgi:Yip1-like protein